MKPITLKQKKSKAELEKQWREAIELAKSLMQKTKDHQLTIATVALSICEISHGGASKAYKDKYTVKKFAEEAGINPRTLSNWIGIKTLVIDKLSISQKKKAKWADAIYLSGSVTRDMKPQEVQKRFDDFQSCDTFQRKIMRYAGELRSLHYNFRDHAAVFKCDEYVLKEIAFYARNIYQEIVKERKDLKPEVTGLVTRVRSTATKGVLGKTQAKKAKKLVGFRAVA